jgi:hypothetical protein
VNLRMEFIGSDLPLEEAEEFDSVVGLLFAPVARGKPFPEHLPAHPVQIPRAGQQDREMV